MVGENDSALNKLRRSVPLSIIVMGVSGSGKSTLGIELARAVGCRFLEGDDLHADAAIAKMRDGQALSDEDRWPWLERVGQAVAAAVTEDSVVVAACSALKRAYRDRLRQIIGSPVFFVLLEADYDELSRRFAERSDHFMPVDLLSSQLLTLEYPHDDEWALTVDARQPPAALCDLIVNDIAARAGSQGQSPGAVGRGRMMVR